MSDDDGKTSQARKRRSHRVQEFSSDSDSDCPVVKRTKRKKAVVESDSSTESSDSEIESRNERRRKMPTIVSEESSSEESLDDVVLTRRVRFESDDSDSDETNYEANYEVSESGLSSAESSSSEDSNLSDDVMFQTAIQESLETFSQSNEVKTAPENRSQGTSSAAQKCGFSSDSSDGQSEKCPICLISFTSQEVGTPETCDHVFCAVCIQEWAKNVNTCPVDRQVFSLILIRKQINGKVIQRIPVQNREARDLVDESIADPTFCEVCGQSDREDRLLLCDGCDLGYHMECLDPPLAGVPVEEWFCPDCANDDQEMAEEVDIQEGELNDLLDELVQIRPRLARLLPRTRQSERVRATIRSIHQEQQRARTLPALQPSTSGIESMGADSSSVASGHRVATTSVSAQRRRKSVRRKTVKKRRKRRVTKRKTTRRKVKISKKKQVKGTDEETDEVDEDDYAPKTKRRKRRKRKIKRRKKKVVRRRAARTAQSHAVTPRSVKGRLAEQLGLRIPSRPGMSLPVVRSSTRGTTSDIDLLRSRAGIPTLHIFGQNNQLDYFSESDSEEVSGGDGVAIATRHRNIHRGVSRLLARKRLSAAALQSHTAVTSPKPGRKKIELELPQSSSVPSAVDLVGSILSSQSIWHSKSSSVTIRPDGSLEVNREQKAAKIKNPESDTLSSICNKDKSDGSLIRSDDRLSEVSGPNSSPVDVGSASGRTTQTPLYPGRGGNSNRPPPAASFHQFGGNRYSAPSYQNYDSGRNYSNFPSASNFDDNNGQAGYSNYNSNLPPPPFRNTPVRFRVTPRYPVRRQGGPRQIPSPKPEKKKTDNGEGSQKNQDEEEEIDIYSDIETGGGGSGGPSAGGSELDETERNMDAGYEALPPPPEPSALLMGLGEQVLSDEDPGSDSELVIDDVGPSSSPHDPPEPSHNVPESEKYDPADPSRDSDEEPSSPPATSGVASEDIPLPPEQPDRANNSSVPLIVVNSSSNSSASYLHSPTYGDTPAFETEKLPTVATDGVVNKVVKEVIQECLSGTSRLVGVDIGHAGKDSPDKDDADECPNFSIYSATSMDIARRNEEEQIEMDEKEESVTKKSEDEEGDEKDDEIISAMKISDNSNGEENMDVAKEKDLPLPSNTDEKEVEEIEISNDEQDEDNISSSEDLPLNKTECEENVEVNADHVSESSDVEHDASEDVEEREASSKSPKQDGNENAEALQDNNENADDALQDKCDVLKGDTFESDDESLIGGATSAVSAGTVENNFQVTSAPSGLEGLDTETISETEEAINFDDDSQDGKEFVSAEEDGEISSGRKKKKKKAHRTIDGDRKELSDLSGELSAEKEKTPLEEGEIIDDRPKVHDTGKKEKKSVEKKDKSKYEKESGKVPDENFDASKSKDDDKKKKKKEKRKSAEKKDEDRPVLGSSENKRKSKEKARKSEENISWKKPSKNTKERNYRDTKTSKAEEGGKEREEKEDNGKEASSKKKKKEKRKDMERYDVRKIVSDKRRRRKDEFGRDLSRDRTFSRSRSRSHGRSHDKSRQRSRSRSRSLSRGRINRSRHQSPGRQRRSRSRSRFRSRSRSYRRSQSRSRNRSKRRSKERNRRSRSKDRTRMRVTRSRSRGRRSRSRSHSRQKNKVRLRSRSRSPVKARERKDRSHILRETQRFHARRSWSRTWTPSWSRSHSRSLSCSSFTHSRSPSVRFNRSFSRSFSRSWSRERYERIPLEKTGTLSSKAPKKLTVIVSNTKDTSERQKKDKKKKKGKNKDIGIAGEKRKKRKEKSPAPSKEVFTSGDNILVSVNFNKSKLPANKDLTSALTTLSKDVAKRKREEAFETERELGKKIRKEKAKDKNKGTVMEKNILGAPGEKKLKKQVGKGNRSARMAAALKQKPVAIIDLDQSPFREQTPSPRDLIVLSDTDDDAQGKEVEREEIEVRRGMRSDSTSPQSSSKGALNVPAGISGTRTPDSELPLLSAVSNYLLTSTGPKTPPEPQVKFSIATKQPQIRSISNPLQEDDDILPEDAGLDDSDRRMVEELERGISEIVHKGPNTPPEPRGPTTPCSPPTSPDAYDPFDPTKSGTPSPAGPEASMDGPPSPPTTPAEEMLQHSTAGGTAGRVSPLPSDLDELVNKNTETRVKTPLLQANEEATEETCKSPDRNKAASRGEPILAKSPVGMSDSVTLQPQIQKEELPQTTEMSEGSKVCLGLPSITTSVAVSESANISPDRKMSVITTQQTKLQSTPNKPAPFPVTTMKTIPTSQPGMTSTPSHSTAPAPLFPALTPVNIATILCTPPANLGMNRANLFNPPAPLSVPTLLQHVSNTAVPQTRLPSEKAQNSTLPMRVLVQNGEQLPKPQDTTTEVVDMDLDSPYSPGSSEGDDLFDPPAETPTRTNQPPHSAERLKPMQGSAKNNNKLSVPPAGLPKHKSPIKPQDTFDSIFAKTGAPVLMPLAAPAAGKAAKSKGHKGAKTKAKPAKGGKKEIAIKMDEDQLQILEELPSSAVELQVKDKFLKKLNRQERVVEEVKLSLKPHYNRKHITKEEYKNILRKSVPKICHNKSGEINPIKIASLVEAYVRKVRYEKKKTSSSVPPAKGKVAKTTMWS